METQEQKADKRLGELKQGVFFRLNFISAVTSKCLLVAVDGDNPCPRLISVEEKVTHATPSRPRFPNIVGR